MPGVMTGFAEHLADLGAGPPRAGRSERARRRRRPRGRGGPRRLHRGLARPARTLRGRIHLACVPMTDADEAAAIVNALQRHATVVIQKSLAEGFGLTVAEAMWKRRR